MTAMRPLEVGRGVFPPHIFLSFFFSLLYKKHMYVCKYRDEGRTERYTSTCLLVYLLCCIYTGHQGMRVSRIEGI